jgi:hypothetical protein
MLLEICSSAAFAPPPPLALYEPADRHAIGLVPARVRTLPPQANFTAATTEVDNQSSQCMNDRSQFARMAVDLSKRIQLLKVEAEMDEIPFSVASYMDFLSFIRDVQPRSRPSLFLNDNGNLRALWRNHNREQIGLQFLGGGNIQFVIFKSRPGAEAMTRVAGTDARANILAHIKASGALSLLAA